MPVRLRESTSIFLPNSTLPPHRPANMPKGFLFPEISGESGGYVLLSVPACHNFHVLDRWVFHTSIVFRPAV